MGGYVPCGISLLLLAIVLLSGIHILLTLLLAIVTGSGHAIFVIGSHVAHLILLSLLLSAVCALTQHDDLVLGLSKLPTAEDQQVRSDSRRCVPEPNSRGLTQILAFLP